jgi:hypothetical protein
MITSETSVYLVRRPPHHSVKIIQEVFDHYSVEAPAEPDPSRWFLSPVQILCS